MEKKKKMEVFKVHKTGQHESWEHQKKVAEILDKMDSRGNFSTIVTVPTGGGKTKIAVDFCLERLKKDNNKIVWMSDSIDLLIQSMERFRDSNTVKKLNYQFLCGTKVYSNFKRTKESKENVHNISIKVSDLDIEADIIFPSVETVTQDKSYKDFSNWLEKVQKNGKVYILYDEVHHVGALKMGELLEKLHDLTDGETVLSNFGIIGFTATVYRHDSPVRSFHRWFKDGYNEGKICTDNNTGYGDGTDEYINNSTFPADIFE